MENSDTEDAPSIEPAGLSQGEVSSEIADTTPADIEDSNNAEMEEPTELKGEPAEPKLVRRRRTKTDVPPEEVEVPTAS